MWSYLTTRSNWGGSSGIGQRIIEHLQFCAIGLVFALLIALPPAIAAGHTGRFGFLAVNVSNIGRAVPSLAFLALAATLLPHGFSSKWPTVIALVALAIPPLVTNTYVGMRQADPDAVDAARGMGMTPLQIALRVEFRLAMPLVMAGLRTATTNVIATAALAALVTQGGLGRLIVDGSAQADRPQEVTGAVLIAALAVVADGLLVLLGHAVSPPKAAVRRPSRFRGRLGRVPVRRGLALAAED